MFFEKIISMKDVLARRTIRGKYYDRRNRFGQSANNTDDAQK